MTQTSPLDRVVRRVSSLSAPREPGEHPVIVDPRRRQVLERPPWFRVVQYWLVSSTAGPTCDGPTLTIQELATNRRLRMKSRYLVTCPPGQQGKVALAFADAPNPYSLLNTLLEAWAQSLIRDEAHPFESFGNLRDRLKDELERKAREQLGLSLKIVLSPETPLETFSIITEPFRARTRDWDEEFPVTLEMDLQPDPDHEVVALIHPNCQPQIEREVCERTRRFLLEEADLHTVVFRRDTDLRPQLAAALTPVVRAYGRKLAYLRLRTDVAAGTDSSRQLKVTVECTIKDSSRPVVVENDLLMTLQDLGRWKGLGAADLDEWCRKVVRRITQAELFEKTYVDLLLEFSPAEDAIKRAVQQEAKQAGYSVQHHLVIPDLPPLKLPKGFSLTVDGKFPTRDSRMTVELEVFVSGKVPDLRRIEKLLRPEVDVLEEMRTGIRLTIEERMHGIPPRRFYTGFLVARDGEEAVAEELRAAVEELLTSEFGAESLVVIPKARENDLMRRAAGLFQGLHAFDFEAEPLHEAGYAEPVRYEGHFEVRGILDWFIFHARNFTSVEEEIAAIKRVLTEALAGQLSVLQNDIRQYRGVADINQIMAHIANQACHKVKTVFGVAIHIVNLRRRLTEIEGRRWRLESDLAEIALDNELAGARATVAASLEEFNLLIRKKQQLLDEGALPDMPDVVALENEIARLRTSVTERPRDHGAKLLTGKAPETQSEPDWMEHRRSATLGMEGFNERMGLGPAPAKELPAAGVDSEDKSL